MICPENIKKIHIVGVCGTAMGNLAVGLKNEGYQITGSDSGIYPPMSDFLRENGIKVKKYSEKNLENTDLVIIGNAIPRGNLEVEYTLNNKIPFISLPEALNTFFVKNKKLIMITGTHGKTTTSSLVAYILEYNGLKPSFLIGGIIPQLKTGFKYNKNSEYFVLEGDEYDTAFFDKTSKFLKFTPDYLTVNYLEFDHGDIFSSLKEVKKSFIHLLKRCPEKAVIFFNRDDRNTYNLQKHSFSQNKTFGFKKGSDVKVDFIEFKEKKSVFKISTGKKDYIVKSSLHGKHNARNIAAAFAVCMEIGIKPEDIAEAIENFSGVKKRFETFYKNEKSNIVVIRDFAHHPTAFKYAIETAKTLFPNMKLIALIEPATNTIRSGKFTKKIAKLSELTDLLVFLPVPNKKRHGVKDNFSPPDEKNIVNLKDMYEIKNFIVKNNFKNTVFLFMSNASPDKYMEIVRNYYEKQK